MARTQRIETLPQDADLEPSGEFRVVRVEPKLPFSIPGASSGRLRIPLASVTRASTAVDRPYPTKGNPVDETTPDAPDGRLSSSTSTGCEDRTE